MIRLLQLRLVTLLWAGLLCGCREDPDDETLLFPEDANYAGWVGRPIGEAGFRGTDLNGQPISLEAYRGRVLLLDFWASWSPKCMEMFPSKLDAYKKHHHAGLEIIGINADFTREDLDKVLNTESPPWPQHFNRAGEADAAVRRFGITHFPSLWLVDRQGVVRHISAGRDLETKIELLLAESATPATTPDPPARSWKDRLLGAFKGGPAPDPDAARKAVIDDPKAYLDVKNVLITAKRRVATVKTTEATHQVVVGKTIAVSTRSGPVQLVCQSIESDGLTFQLAGRREPFKIDF